MANPVTSKKVARKASKLLRRKNSTKNVKSVSGAALGGARGGKSTKKGKK